MKRDVHSPYALPCARVLRSYVVHGSPSTTRFHSRRVIKRKMGCGTKQELVRNDDGVIQQERS